MAAGHPEGAAVLGLERRPPVVGPHREARQQVAHAEEQRPSDIALVEQLPEVADAGGVAPLGADAGDQTRAARLPGQRLGFGHVEAQRPLAVDHLAGGQRLPGQWQVGPYRHRDGDKIDVVIGQ